MNNLKKTQLALTQGLNQKRLAITEGFDKIDEVKKWELAQLPGFEAIEGVKKEEEDDDFFDASDEEKPSASFQPLKKETKTISFTSEDSNKYLMSKKIQEILKEENLPLPSAFKTDLSDLELTKKYYNKAEEKINDLKKGFNPIIITTNYEDGRYIAYPKSKNPLKDT